MSHPRGFIPVMIIITISVIAVSLAGVGLWYKMKKEAEPAVNTQVNVNTEVNTNATVNGNTNAVVNSNTTNDQNVNNSDNTIASSQFSYKTVKVGDRVGGMVVTKVEQFQTEPQYRNITPNNKISFSGEVTITGTIDARFSEFGGSNQVCVSKLNDESLKLMPKAIEDTRSVSFCFSNIEKALQIYPVDTTVSATFSMDNYVINDYPSEVFNTGTFISTSDSTAGWETYTNGEYSISYPMEWSIDGSWILDEKGERNTYIGKRLRDVANDNESTLEKSIDSWVPGSYLDVREAEKKLQKEIVNSDTLVGYLTQWDLIIYDKIITHTRADFESKTQDELVTNTGTYLTVYFLTAQDNLNDTSTFKKIISTFKIQ